MKLVEVAGKKKKEQTFISLVRKTLGYKGTSWHTGRGAYMMEFQGCHSWPEMKDRVLNILVPKMKQLGTFQDVQIRNIGGFEVINVVGTYSAYGAYSEFACSERDIEGGAVHMRIGTEEEMKADIIKRWPEAAAAFEKMKEEKK